mmetsp:Transcript_86444/g.242000  ORF Transcript_86444/g.242000 Transcript_86444/m.242000 type:complete len:286 (+) Transcript_86444:516-1373(+)
MEATAESQAAVGRRGGRSADRPRRGLRRLRLERERPHLVPQLAQRALLLRHAPAQSAELLLLTAHGPCEVHGVAPRASQLGIERVHGTLVLPQPLLCGGRLGNRRRVRPCRGLKGPVRRNAPTAAIAKGVHLQRIQALQALQQRLRPLLLVAHPVLRGGALPRGVLALLNEPSRAGPCTAQWAHPLLVRFYALGRNARLVGPGEGRLANGRRRRRRHGADGAEARRLDILPSRLERGTRVFGGEAVLHDGLQTLDACAESHDVVACTRRCWRRRCGLRVLRLDAE